MDIIALKSNMLHGCTEVLEVRSLLAPIMAPASRTESANHEKTLAM
jgi:hypothetical protein